MVAVLMYHEIAASRQAANRFAVPPDMFATQLALLKSEGFSTLTASTLVEALSRGARLPERSVVLTFDDGFADLHKVALPLLAHYDFTATVYVTTDWIEDGRRPSAKPRPGQMLTWPQLHDLAAAGMEVGAHGRSHRELDQLTEVQSTSELRISKEILENELGRPVAGMAYPFGYSNATVRQVTGETGYRYACAVRNRSIASAWDPFALPRLTVRRSTSLRQFHQLIQEQNVDLMFAKDHLLTEGWAVIRRSRAALNRFILRPNEYMS